MADPLDRPERQRNMAGGISPACRCGSFIDHPERGLLHLDCDVLTTHRGDLRVVVCTAAPGSESARQLDVLRGASSRQPSVLPAGHLPGNPEEAPPFVKFFSN
jgi:hypothetical protein